MTPNRQPRRRGAIALLCVLSALALPSTALASYASVSGGVLTYDAGGAEINQVTLGYSNDSILVDDSGAVIQAGPGCTISQRGHRAACSYVTSIVLNLSDGADTAASALLFTPVTIDGGEGDDRLTGSTTPDKLAGGPGADTLGGGWGNDTITGGDGIDTVDAGLGSDKIYVRDGSVDTLVCGSGTDSGERDAEDSVAADCESVVPPGVDPPADEPDPAGEGATGESGTTITAPIEEIMPVVLPQAPRANPRGAIAVRVHCPQVAAGGCVGTVSVALAGDEGVAAARRRRTVPRTGRRRFKLAAGQTKAVPVLLARRAARRLKSRRAVRMKVTVEVEVDGGQVLKSERLITVRERRTANRRVSKGRKGGKRR